MATLSTSERKSATTCPHPFNGATIEIHIRLMSNIARLHALSITIVAQPGLLLFFIPIYRCAIGGCLFRRGLRQYDLIARLHRFVCLTFELGPLLRHPFRLDLLLYLFELRNTTGCNRIDPKPMPAVAGLDGSLPRTGFGLK